MEKKSIITETVNVSKIRDYMKQNNLTQKQFAEKCNLNIWNLQSVLSDYKNYKLIYLFKIAKAMDVTVADLCLK